MHCPCFLAFQVFTREELQVIADLCIKHDTLCISDEVYEWLVYKGKKHIKIGTDFFLCMWYRRSGCGMVFAPFSEGYSRSMALL